MNKTLHKLAIATGLAAGLITAQTAQAVVIHGVATGTVSSGVDRDTANYGANANTWGFTGTTDLTGQEFRVDFSYDTALAPPDSNAGPNAGLYSDCGDGICGDQAGWLGMDLTINSVTRHFGGTSQSFVAFIDDGSRDFYVTVSIDDVTNAHHALSQYLILQLFPPAQDFLSGDALTQTFSWGPSESNPVTSVFAIGDRDYDQGTYAASRGILALTSLTLTTHAVPEPAPLALLAAGFIGLAWSRRRAGRDAC